MTRPGVTWRHPASPGVTWSIALAVCLTLVAGRTPMATSFRVPAPPTALTITSATRAAVGLSWTGDVGAKFVVERKAAGAAWPAPAPPFAATPAMPTPSAIAVVDAAQATDGKIDAFATYVYRVRAIDAAGALSAPTNEVTAGPPPTGFSQIVATPKAMQEHDPNQFGSPMQMVLDANGDPALAYVVSDVNNDGDNGDSDLNFISWNRARYTWNAPVKLATVGDVVRSGSRIAVSIARDGGTGRLAVAHLVGALELHVTMSLDAGATWTDSLVMKTAPEDGGESTPSIALGGGRAYLAYYAHAQVQYRTGLATDPVDKWTTSTAPKLPGTFEPRSEGIVVALDGGGQPGVTYWLTPNDGYNVTLAFWRPAQSSVVKVFDTDNHQMDDPASNLVISGTTAAVIAYANRDDKFFDNHQLWFVRSTDGGGTWSPPVAIVNDGGNTMGSPITVSLDRAGRVAASAELAGGNADGTKCGRPKLLRSADGVRWTVCTTGPRGFASNADTFPLLAFAANDKLYYAFLSRQPGGGLAPGLILWREP